MPNQTDVAYRTTLTAQGGGRRLVRVIAASGPEAALAEAHQIFRDTFGEEFMASAVIEQIGLIHEAAGER